MSKKFTFEELKELNGKDNLHLLISGKVYDIAKFIDEHPGGDEVLFGEAGRDATEAFEDVGHSDEAREILAKYLVGECDEVATKGPSNADDAAKRGLSSGSSSSTFIFLLPLAALVAFLAYHFSQQS
ncbi:cytochrome b5 [Cystobasidium minutum MCA 4210]|uniref:cytochrome b5 n=1 Tax=Cystobasidium minutum MCA 4210 TaxID=1397322 RepID=UPI0034CDEAFB|eukprot:jgi/Rhomi1/169614/fgenesh1_kg.3_\